MHNKKAGTSDDCQPDMHLNNAILAHHWRKVKLFGQFNQMSVCAASLRYQSKDRKSFQHVHRKNLGSVCAHSQPSPVMRFFVILSYGKLSNLNWKQVLKLLLALKKLTSDTCICQALSPVKKGELSFKFENRKLI